MWAAEFGKLNDVSSFDKYVENVYFLGKKDTLDFLIRKGGNINLDNGDGDTALTKAIRSGNLTA